MSHRRFLIAACFHDFHLLDRQSPMPRPSVDWRSYSFSLYSLYLLYTFEQLYRIMLVIMQPFAPTALPACIHNYNLTTWAYCRGSRGKLAGKSVFLQIIDNDNAYISVFSPRHSDW